MVDRRAVTMAKGPGLTSSLTHRDFRQLMLAFTGSSIGSWAYNVALVVWIFDETGSAAWVGASTIVRFVPAVIFGVYGGVIAERFERVRLMVVVDACSAAVMAAMALATALDAPVVLVMATAAVTSSLSTVYEPATAALTPQLVGEKDLGSANALRNTIDNVAVIVGPALGTLVLLLGPPPVAIAVNALTFVASAVAISRIRARSTPVDVTEGGEAGLLQQTLVGVRAITSSSTALVLVAYSVVATVVFGIDTVMFVLLSRDVLGTGAEGYGYLLAGLGVGGVLAAGLVTRLEQVPHLSVVIMAGMVAYCLPTLVFLVSSEPAVGFAAQVVRGAGTLVVDVLAITALQRSLPRDLLARVFGAFDTMVLLAVIAGSLLVPPVVSLIGLDGLIWVTAVGVPVGCLLGWPALRRMDREAAERRAALAPRTRLLAECDLFGSVSEGAILQLAGAADDQHVDAGVTVIREGDVADAFYVIVAGRASVTAQGEHASPRPLGVMSVGDHFGEIGLVEQIPRTATVRTETPCDLLRIDGPALLTALTESAPSAAFLDGAATRLGRSHPSLALTRSGLRSAEGERPS
jgi:MFS family permease